MLRHTHPRTAALAQGFTLIEVMIVVAVIGILSSIAYPSYTEYVLRAKITEVTATLQGLQADMERHYQNHRTYAEAAACSDTSLKNFTIKCIKPSAPENADAETKEQYTKSPYEFGYSLIAQGEGFIFSIDQRDDRRSKEFADKQYPILSETKDLSSFNKCWIQGKGKKC